MKEQGATSGDKKEPDIMDSVESEIIANKSEMSKDELQELKELGLKKILFGKVALVVLAGGDGTRLGSS